MKIPDTKQKCTDYNCKPPSLLPPYPSHLLFHLPKVSSFPHFPHTFRRCAEAEHPREPAVAAFLPPPCLSHLPKAGSFLRFPHTFRRWADAAPPREMPVTAFPRPPYLSHLQKVSIFPRFLHTFRRWERSANGKSRNIVRKKHHIVHYVSQLDLFSYSNIS